MMKIFPRFSRHTTTLGLFACAYAVTAGVVSAQAPANASPSSIDRAGQLMNRLEEGLKLTDAQVEVLQPIIDAHVIQQAELLNELKTAESRRAKRDILTHLRDNKDELEEHLAEHLTDEQFAQYLEVRETLREKAEQNWRERHYPAN